MIMQLNERYLRQMILPGFGQAGQDSLRSARVLLVGMGGLGCPALQYLAGSGVSNLGIIDPDHISISNLHRQLLFGENDLGKYKADVAAVRMKELDQELNITTYKIALSNNNALDIINQYDLVIDGTDNFTAKYLINDACRLLKKPMIYGAVNRFEGQVSVFNLFKGKDIAFSYRDLFPVTPLPGEIPSCEEAGVLGALPGIIGAIQAAEAIKIITGIGLPLQGTLFTYDLLQARSYEIAIIHKPTYHPNDEESFLQMNYAVTCGEETDIPEVSIREFLSHTGKPNVFVLDVRERHEFPVIDFADAQIPMSELETSLQTLPEKDIYVICHQGIRSIYAAQIIKAHRNLLVYSVKGGLTAYFNQIEA